MRISPFFDSLSAYIDNSRKTELVEILSGRLAMVSLLSLFLYCFSVDFLAHRTLGADDFKSSNSEQ